MNKLLILTASASLLALSSFAADADDTPTTCGLWTLHGTMDWGATAMNVNTGRAFSNSGMESYDGLGHLKYYELQSDGYTQHKWIGTGTYTITSNCIATVIYDGEVTYPYTYFVAPDGSAYYYNNNLGIGRVAGGKVDRISRTLLVQ